MTILHLHCTAELNLLTIRTISEVLGDCRKRTYQITQDFCSSSRRDYRRIVALCNCNRNADEGQKDKKDGMFFDRNRLS